MTKHRRKVRSLARKLLYEEGLPWMEALAEAMLRSQCAARTRSGLPCRRAGVGKNGRCVKHGGASTGPRTAEGRARVSQGARTRPGITASWFLRSLEYLIGQQSHNLMIVLVTSDFGTANVTFSWTELSLPCYIVPNTIVIGTAK